MNQEIQNKKKEYAADIFSIKEARLRIQPFIHQTPVLSSESINAASGKQLFFKCECFQKGGAFKFRGACNAIYSLDDDLAAKGVVTHSSGNHAAALSLAAKLRGIPAYVVIPENAPKCKVENVVRYGGQVIWSEATVQSRETVAKKVMQDTGAVLIHPYNDGRIISGQGTISLELLEQVPQLDTLIVPISGGGLISGISVAAKSINPAIRIFGAEPKGANDAAMSKATGKIVTLAETNTIADGLRAFLGDLTWPIIRDLVDDIITVEDKEIIEAMRLCYEILKVVVEPSGAIGLAAVLSDSFKQHPCWKDCDRVGIILSGVIKFARATGDLQTLSDVDLKLIALTYTLEAQIHGTQHLRDCPPPIHTVNVKRLPEKDLPGWGSNVPNMEEWEALEQNDDDPSNSNSKILPLQDLNLNIIPSDAQSENGSLEHKNENDLEHHDETESGSRKSRRFPSEKKEINIEGKMVADGIDASQGQYDDNAGDWMPAVSRSTQRRYYRRKARREYNESLAEKDGQQEVDRSTNGDIQEETTRPDQSQDQISELSNIGNGIADSPIAEGMSNNKNLSDILKQMRLEEDSSNVLHVEGLDTPAMEESDKSKVDDVTSDHNFSLAVEGVGSVGGMEKDELEQLDNSSITNESVDTSFVDDATSEQSWMLRSLSESSVACVTGDFAMQNVLLQMGLRLLAPGGMQIRELHRWILKCHACYTVTAEIGRIFCPKCGNGGTLRKVAVTVGENGVVLAARKPRITLRGTKFSLPLPQSGRDAITKNLVLREDQLPQKFLHPKTKKKVKKEGDDEFFTSDDFFNHHTDRRGPLQPPVRQALAVFSGKRNPNDNHYSRSKHR